MVFKREKEKERKKAIIEDRRMLKIHGTSLKNIYVFSIMTIGMTDKVGYNTLDTIWKLVHS